MVVQEISGRLGRITGHGLAAAMRQAMPAWLVTLLVGLLVIVNVINLGADIGAMAASVKLVVGGPQRAYALLIAAFCAGCEIWLAYKRYVTVLKWLTLSLFTYVALLFVVHLPLREALLGALVPRLAVGHAAITALVAVLGTTISPYLFFWQAATESEDMITSPDPRPLREHPADAPAQLTRIGIDTVTGMVLSNLVALAVIDGAAATLHAHGVTNVATAADAAAALRPIAGPLASLVFAAGIIGTGLLAVPALAGSAAYAVGETLGWTVGLGRRAMEARAFYGMIALATLLGTAIVFSPLDPMKALFWSSVINGVIATPMIAALVAVSSRREVMGSLVLSGPLRVMGWLTAVMMAAATVAMLTI